MIERVGNCAKCSKTIYCENGFFTGIVQENGEILCFDCEQSLEENETF